MSTATKPLLTVEHLEISCRDSEKTNPIVQDVSFQLYKGEMAALTGPSGCGKSVTAHAVVGMLEKEWIVTKGHICYKNQNITTYSEKEWQRLRREEIALLIQHSLNGLNPIRTVKKQMMETLNQRRKLPRKEAVSYLHSLLHQVGFADPAFILSSYPFELSGGMCQRILLAMMLSAKPKILIADEPTTALDVINKEKVMALLKKLQADFDLAVLLISHDQESVNRFADRVIFMEQGGVTG
ncbi:ATP-binding cassette domain-containing protein [Domibacillus indicus]|uniref:ATP-binding cassette domain-containing protein n=1 Tax=Domibacillus indicus TaxID=1437523 RepID=UPI000617CD13|nr:ABC transporter ATP-binding protein [Domibacillus indicus]